MNNSLPFLLISIAARPLSTPMVILTSSLAIPAFSEISLRAISLLIASKNRLSGRPFFRYFLPFLPKITSSTFCTSRLTNFLFCSHCKARMTSTFLRPVSSDSCSRESVSTSFGRTLRSRGWSLSMSLVTSIRESLHSEFIKIALVYVIKY